MSRDWEATFSTWSLGPGETEKKRAENAESMIKAAIAESPKLQNRRITVFTQGSYRNRVNVRKDSDVDIGVKCHDTYFPDYPDENVKAILEKTTSAATYKFDVFKSELEEALVAKFGKASVKRGNKALNVSENSYRVESDVSPFFLHRRYISETQYHEGVQMLTDNGSPILIRNWPEQHYKNGVEKNDRSGRRIKRMVRIIKSLRNEMNDRGILSASQAPSFLLECLVFNTPDQYFYHATVVQNVHSVLSWLIAQTKSDASCGEWGEVSELKYLFKGTQSWTRQSAHSFLVDALVYVRSN